MLSEWDAEGRLEHEAARSLQRLLPRLREHSAARSPGGDWAAFEARLRQHFPRLFGLLLRLYGGHYDFFYHLERLLAMAARMALARPAELKALDAQREAEPLWFQSERNLGGVCYVDRFAGTLAGVREHLDYLGELGLTYLHLMPLFPAPEGNNDGGYAVSSYREVDPRLGSMPELAELASELRRRGISLVLDFVINHTSDEHQWAQRALAGDPDYQAYYWMFPDRIMPDAYERHVREIFPGEHPGSFTHRPEIGRWVWTTFHMFQWDLNYRNPTVFRRMAEEMLFLANQGVEVLRLDAVAFLWKDLGTPCEGLPEAHLVVQAWNALARIAAPALMFKSEAIVHPDEVVKYIGWGEAQLSYNPLLMALLWDSLATRDVRLLEHSLRKRFGVPANCAWVNYVRSHDDIGWTFADEDAAEIGINGFDHRQFLNAFYFGRFPGSFARGLPFQENPKTGDARVSGSGASLAGLEKALADEGPRHVELAIRRILLLHSVVLSIGGMPLIYLGDELGTLNHYAYQDNACEASDSRWVHRPRFDWGRTERRHDAGCIEGHIYGSLRHLIDVRRSCPAFAGSEMQVLSTGNPHAFAYVRGKAPWQVVVVTNFTEQEQSIGAEHVTDFGLGAIGIDLVRAEVCGLDKALVLEPYHVLWLMALPPGQARH
jgi:amylosucrase